MGHQNKVGEAGVVDLVTADSLDGTFVPRPRPSVAGLELDGDTVLLDAETGGAHRLDPVASVVWSCFDGSGSLDEIVDDLSAEFAADRERVLQDVVTLARLLGEEGLLEGVAPSPVPHPTATHGHGPGLCDDHGHEPDEPTLYSARVALAAKAARPQPATAGVGEPKFLVEPPSS